MNSLMPDCVASDRATRSVMRPFQPWTTLMIAEGRAVATRRRRRWVSESLNGRSRRAATAARRAIRRFRDRLPVVDITRREGVAHHAGDRLTLPPFHAANARTTAPGWLTDRSGGG